MKKNNHLLPEWEEIAATAMAVQNIWISCVGSNIGGYWSTPKYITKLNSFLSLNEDEICLGFFYLGVYKSCVKRNIKRKNISEKMSTLEPFLNTIERNKKKSDMKFKWQIYRFYWFVKIDLFFGIHC